MIDGKVTTDFPVTPESRRQSRHHHPARLEVADLRGTTRVGGSSRGSCRTIRLFIEKEIKLLITIVPPVPSCHEVIYR